MEMKHAYPFPAFSNYLTIFSHVVHTYYHTSIFVSKSFSKDVKSRVSDFPSIPSSPLSVGTAPNTSIIPSTGTTLGGNDSYHHFLPTHAGDVDSWLSWIHLEDLMVKMQGCFLLVMENSLELTHCPINYPDWRRVP